MKRTSKNLIRASLLLTAAICAATQASAGIVNYEIVNPYVGTTGPNGTASGYADLEVYNLSIDDHSGGVAQYNLQNAFVGGIEISQNPGGNNSSLPENYTTVCTDVSGTVYLGQTYNYTAPTTFSATQGLAPTWGADNGPGASSTDKTSALAAIENAAQIFNTAGGANLATTGMSSLTAQQMADVQLGIWISLYDTTASGQIVYNGNSRFQVQGGVDATVQNWINTLNGQYSWNGYVLFPTPGAPSNINADGETPQELLLALSSVTPVPEPTTMVAGAFLLLPFGMSTLRFVRRKPTA